MNSRASLPTEPITTGKITPTINTNAVSSLPLQQEDIQLSQNGALTALTDFQKSTSSSNSNTDNNIASDANVKS